MDILEEFRKNLIETYESKNSVESYFLDISQFIKYFKEKFSEDIVIFSRADFMEYNEYMKNERGYKYATINRKIATLSIYEDFLIEKGIKKDKKVIRKRDFYKIEIPLVTSDMLPRDTIKKIRLKAGRESKREYAMFVILNEGGLRISELLDIELERDIDLNMRKIFILGKGKKVREVFINNIMKDAIQEYLPERALLLNGRTNKYLFVSNKTANTNRSITRNSINNLLNKYCEELKEEKINPHIFRHDGATLKYEQGFTDMGLKKFLGDSSNVVGRYVHPGGERNK